MTAILNRRDFLKNSSIGFAGTSVFGANIFQKTVKTQSPRIKKYRTLGRTKFKVSDIGCGTSILNDKGVLKQLINLGVNYIDTAPGYGQSEVLIGNAIKNVDRKSLFITTKARPPRRGWKTAEEILLKVRGSLERLQTDYIDCLMIHDAKEFDILKSKPFHSAVAQLKNEGRVRFCGVSCHGASLSSNPKHTMEEILLAAVEDGRFDVLLIAYNFLNDKMGKTIMKACKTKNIGTTIMKTDPYNRYFELQELIERWTKEKKEVPGWVKRLVPKFKGFKNQAGPFIEKYGLETRDEIKGAAIRFALDNPNAHCVLLSFLAFDDVTNYLRHSGMSLSALDKATIFDYNESFGNLYCRHACGLCESKCPYNVPVNTIMRYDQYYLAQNRKHDAKKKYAELSGPKANLCQKDCPAPCESACPYDVPIQGLLNLAHDNLGNVC